jgi:hypothetical protein
MSTLPGAHRAESAPDSRPSPATTGPSSVTTRRHVGHHLPLPVDQVGHPTDLRLRLPDSRFLGYAEYGDRDGQPLLFFHGTYGSRRMGQVLDRPRELYLSKAWT